MEQLTSNHFEELSISVMEGLYNAGITWRIAAFQEDDGLYSVLFVNRHFDPQKDQPHAIIKGNTRNFTVELRGEASNQDYKELQGILDNLLA